MNIQKNVFRIWLVLLLLGVSPVAIAASPNLDENPPAQWVSCPGSGSQDVLVTGSGIFTAATKAEAYRVAKERAMADLKSKAKPENTLICHKCRDENGDPSRVRCQGEEDGDWADDVSCTELENARCKEGDVAVRCTVFCRQSYQNRLQCFPCKKASDKNQNMWEEPSSDYPICGE